MSTSGSPARGLRLAPFRGLRYVPERVGSLAAVTSPPYDVVIRPDGQRHLAAADPHNVVRLILPPASHQAAWTLCQWQHQGILAADPEPALYVYEQHDGDLLQRGLIGALRLTPPVEGVVLPHEDVMPGPVAERAALMRATAANLEPLLLVYRGGTTAAEVVDRTAEREPLLSTTTEDGVSHRLWRITDPDEIETVNADLSTRQALIADGHHRWATYLRLQSEQSAPSPWDYGLVLLVDTARYPLRVRAIHRVLPNLPVTEAISAVQGVFRIRDLPGRPLRDALAALQTASAEGNAFLLAGDGGFRLLDRPDPQRLDRSVPHDHPEAWRRLDATVLHSLLLDDIWQVPDTSEHISYIHNADAAVEQAERRGGTAVLMHPVGETLVRELALQGITMPRKSTSFGPKPATGLVMRSLDLD